jgi:hypothetical protein
MPSRAGIARAVLCAACLAGCRFAVPTDARLDPDPPGSAVRPEDLAASPRGGGRTAAKTLPVELVFVRLDTQDSEMRDDLWKLVDEQALDDALRRRLAANGLRAGIVTSQLPVHLARRFHPGEAAAADGGADAPAPEPVSATPTVVRRTMNLLSGRASEVVAAGGIQELVLLEHDGMTVRGGTYHQASSVWSLRCWPAADGRLRIQLTPTIKHGPMERSWVGEDGVFRLDTGQRRNVLERLRFEANVPPDAMIVVSCAGDESSSVGDAFFRDRLGGDGPAGGGSMRLLAIRPLSRAADPMFAGEDQEASAAGADPAGGGDPAE